MSEWLKRRIYLDHQKCAGMKTYWLSHIKLYRSKISNKIN